MVDMQWQFMDEDYYKSNCLGAMYNNKAIQVNNAEFGKLDHPELPWVFTAFQPLMRMQTTMFEANLNFK